MLSVGVKSWTNYAGYPESANQSPSSSRSTVGSSLSAFAYISADVGVSISFSLGAGFVATLIPNPYWLIIRLRRCLATARGIPVRKVIARRGWSNSTFYRKLDGGAVHIAAI